MDNLKEIHRPWIDEIKIKCKECGKEVERIKDVGDAWLDAGIVPFSTLNYLNDREYWKKWFPADLISESMPGQSRGWFNALMWASVAITGKVPFKSLFGYETLKDEKGNEMHKSKGNAIWFNDAVEKMGADPMRLLYCIQDPSQEFRFGYNVVKEPTNNLNIFYNLSNLVGDFKEIKINNVEDKWIISRLNSLIKKFTEEMENLHPHLASRALQDFWINDLSRKYIQFVRDRISADDKSAQFVVKEIYVTLLKMLAPIAPFITEYTWQNFRKKKIVKEESVHLSSFPKCDEKKIDAELEEKFLKVFDIIEKGLSERDKVQIGLKWPLAKATISSPDKFDKQITEIISRQLNVKKIELKNKKQLEVELDTKITPKLEAEGFAREISRQIQSFRKKLGLNKNDKVKTYIITDDKFKKILSSEEDTIKERTNSDELSIVTTDKERFKNKMGFEIRDKKGEIAIIKKITTV